MPRRTKGRDLRPEEVELWQAVARTARPLRKGGPAPARVEAAPPAPQPEERGAADLRSGSAPLSPWPPEPLPVFRLGEKAKVQRRDNLAPKPDEGPLRMDARLHQKMTRGKIAPEARIDLHGMTLAEAHPELINFLLGAHAKGMRLVLVITGKGKQMWEPVPRPIGALRHQLPHWLRLPPLSHIVLQFNEAHLKHGGSGAWYVYLRRR